MATKQSYVDLDLNAHSDILDNLWAFAVAKETVHSVNNKYLSNNLYEYLIKVDTTTTFVHKDKEYTSEEFLDKFNIDIFSRKKIKFQRKINLKAALCMVSPFSGDYIEDTAIEVDFYINHSSSTELLIGPMLYSSWDSVGGQMTWYHQETADLNSKAFLGRIALIVKTGEELIAENTAKRDEIVGILGKVKV